ncbi:hypothetical protein AC579_2309 [Pseudocercospora musae]|uniref:Uncharacterized protein n=1 Tax=Pseudocercospora musae TaxID=113226 RepID=A0A139GTN9_9PEZI|nr:hypothetical protein AC579_2309 [Pseudocercospora musae]
MLLLILCIILVWIQSDPFSRHNIKSLQIQISTAPELLSRTIESGRIVLLLGRSEDDLNNTDPRYTTTIFFGKNVDNFSGLEDIIFSGSSDNNLETGVFGWPIARLDDVPVGTYFIKAFLNVYHEKVTRSDGSTVSLRFPCGGGQPHVGGSGSLSTNVLRVHIDTGPQTIKLQFQTIVPPPNFDGTEIGGCFQGNYRDQEFLKYTKIRSDALSRFWNRDMYVGASILLPFGYNATDRAKRYPVLYSQFHWLGGHGWWDTDTSFTDAWSRGMLPKQGEEPERPTPELIIVMFRHENPFYDDSYAVNTPNLGPYGDALNDELIPHLDQMFNTIAEPYARIQEGGSTGGWAAAANVIFRPDLFGACFSSYPDSLDFHKHQSNDLYGQSNAHIRDGLPAPSNRAIDEQGVPYVRLTVADENKFELIFGTSGRSALQTDIWFAVFGVQGLNGYPLAAWDKVTGEIFPDAVEFWKHMDLTHYIIDNWEGERNLGEALRGRIFIYVGGLDSYYLNEGVEQFRIRTTEKGGPDWTNVTILPGELHGGTYNLLPKWTYLELVLEWVADHAPSGRTPLSTESTAKTTRGNLWQDVLASGGHQAALARQSPPYIEHGRDGVFNARVGLWDPGVALQAQWIVDGNQTGAPFVVRQGQAISHVRENIKETLELVVTGTKQDYADDRRWSNRITI